MNRTMTLEQLLDVLPIETAVAIAVYEYGTEELIRYRSYRSNEDCSDFPIPADQVRVINVYPTHYKNEMVPVLHIEGEYIG